MGYDMEFVQVGAGSREYPVEGEAARRLLATRVALREVETVTAALLKLPGCRPGPKSSVDFIGRGLSYARLTVGGSGIRVENNCSPAELLKVYEALLRLLPGLVIVDLQSGQVHDAESLRRWWARPL